MKKVLTYFQWSAAILLTVGMTAITFAKVTVGTLSLEREAVPGETYNGVVVVSNDDDATARVSVYQTDYVCTSDGNNQFGEPGKQPRSNASWIVVSPRQLDVPPHQSTNVTCVVRVPTDSTLEGTFWSMLMIEEQPNPAMGLSHEPNTAVVRQVIRYGVQCVTHIRDTGQPKVHFVASRLVVLDHQQKELQIDVENTGERWIVPAPHIELFDMSGHPAGRFNCPQKRIFPGSSVRFQINLGSTPSGRYKALVVLDNGDQQLFGANYDLDF